MTTTNKTYKIVIRSILTAMIILQAMIPFLGFIPLGITSLTIIHITVLVAAIVLGTKDGVYIGVVWGLFTIIRAFTTPTTPLDLIVFTNPIISVIPRALVGLVAGTVFTIMYKKTKKMTLSVIFSSILGTLTNTILVLFFMGTLYTDLVAKTYNVDTSSLFTVLGTIAITNGLYEVVAAVFITPIIVKAIFSATKLTPNLR